MNFIDLKYKPSKDDLVCDFFVEPIRMNIKEAASAVASESSTGTWTETSTAKPYVRKLAAKVFEIRGNNIKIAYPAGLFELGNMPNILSSVAGNVFGLEDLKNLRLNDMLFPKKILRSFRGPKYGIGGIRKILKVKKRVLLGTIIKPKIGLRTEDHVKVAYDAWLGGCDIVKDDENLSSQNFNKFETRIEKTLKARDKAEKITGEKKVYMANITAETNEMIKRAKFVEERSGEYVMVDIMTVGWAALQTLRNQNFNLVIHGHRAGHAALTKNPRHGISMKVVAKIARIIGIDQLHVGTVVGKMFENKKEVLENLNAVKNKLDGIKPLMPVASGGLHPRLVPEVIKIFGNDLIIQAGGGIHGHPLGTMAGVRAMRQAVEATMKKIDLKDYAKEHRELKLALERWKK